ncbi:MAG: DUF721 domain-containing protein [Methylococcales bacterium]|nr:DUF721 domain-containing protein [Methylococcales bacterium]
MAKTRNFFKSVLKYERKIITSYKYQIDIQSKLLQKIKLKLPNELSSHALYCVISGKKISLYTDSAIWSSQLRFYHQTILQAAQNSNQGTFETLQIKIIPKVREIEEKKVSRLPSVENIDGILSQAENQRDLVLKNALFKLGKTLQNKTKKIL